MPPGLTRYGLRSAEIELQVPYDFIGGSFVPFPKDANRLVEIMGPAGSIISSASDMEKWLKMHLNGGRAPDQSTVVSPASLQQTYIPSMFMPTAFTLSRPTFPVTYTTSTYGMGWWNTIYRDHIVLEHGGNVLGHSSLVGDAGS